MTILLSTCRTKWQHKKNSDEVWIKEVGKHEVILRPTNLLMSEEI